MIDILGVGVFAAGLAVLSVKLWTVLDKKRKAAQKQKFPGIIPGYSPLSKQWSGILCTDTEIPHPFFTNQESLLPHNPILSEKQSKRFYKKRLTALRVFVRSEGSNADWHPDFSKNSQEVLYQRMAEYTDSLLQVTLTPDLAWQTNSLSFDIALYQAKIKTEQFPAFALLSQNIFLSDYLTVLNQLSREEKAPSRL